MIILTYHKQEFSIGEKQVNWANGQFFISPCRVLLRRPVLMVTVMGRGKRGQKPVTVWRHNGSAGSTSRSDESSELSVPPWLRPCQLSARYQPNTTFPCAAKTAPALIILYTYMGKHDELAHFHEQNFQTVPIKITWQIVWHPAVRMMEAWNWKVVSCHYNLETNGIMES